MLRSQNKKIKLAATATGLMCKQMFECLVLSSIINRAFMLQVLKLLRMSAISLLNCKYQKCIIDKCLNIIAYKTAGDSAKIEFAR